MVPHRIGRLFLTFLPFWIFLILFKFGSGLHYSLMAPLGERVLPIWLVGFVIGGGALVQLMLDVPAGRLLDNFGYRRLLKVTTLTFVVAVAVFAFDFTLAVYLTSFFLSIFGWLFFTPGVSAYILSQAPQGDAGKFISLRDTAGSVGVVLASAVLGIVLGLDTKMMGVLMFVLLIGAFLSLRLSPQDTRSVHAEKKLATHHYYIRRTSIRQVLRVVRTLNPASTMLLLLGFSSSVFYALIWFIVPLEIARQANSGLLSLGLGIFDFAIVVFGFVLGSIADKGNKRTLVFFGLLLFSVSGLFLGFNFNWLFLVFGFLATTGDEMASISLWSWLHALDRDHAQDGLVAGLITMVQDFGWAIGPVLAGIAYTIIGPAWTIALGAMVIFATWIIYQVLARHYVHEPVLDVPHHPHRARHKS
jgi:MFS family permease